MQSRYWYWRLNSPTTWFKPTEAPVDTWGLAAAIHRKQLTRVKPTNDCLRCAAALLAPRVKVRIQSAAVVQSSEVGSAAVADGGADAGTVFICDAATACNAS